MNSTHHMLRQQFRRLQNYFQSVIKSVPPATWFTCLFLTGILLPGGTHAQSADYTRASVIALSENSDQEILRAATVLQEVVEEKSRVKWDLSEQWPPDDKPAVIVTTKSNISLLPESVREALYQLIRTEEEGYKIIHFTGESKVVILGHDGRGALYGVGYLLRKMELREGDIQIPEALSVSSSPAFTIRGHQLGYRPKTNAYDAWTVDQFDRYIRDLTLFGANSLEITPDKSDDEFENDHMVLPAIEMMAEQSRIAQKYGMDLWLWYPNMGSDYSNPDSIRKELEDHARIFKVLPKLDHLFVPGGDPGDLHPEILFSWLKELVVVLHEYHPEAKIWVSPQVFRPTEEWYDAFYKEVNQGYPWFAGVVYGPWVKETIREVREKVRADLPVRRYPDITHTLLSQFPVEEWDLAYAIALDREPYNPRPHAEKHIHNLFAEYGNGSLSYSEGINDDVNKFVWSDQDWDPSTPVKETLRDYARLFIGPEYAEKIAEGIIALENNFKGPLVTNEHVQNTLRQWQDMEKQASEATLSNYRFQMNLLRAYFDAYLQRRSLYEKELEAQALDILRTAAEKGTTTAFRDARLILESARKNPVRQDLRQRCFELSEAVFESIRSQVTARPPQFAEEGRGNFIDNIDLPLNDSEWLLYKMAEIEKTGDEKDRIRETEALLNRTNPGPGGYYDNLGSAGSWRHMIRQKTWEEDPIGLQGPFADFGASYQGDQWIEILPKGFGENPVPHAWMTQFTTLYDTPLKMKYEELDPDSRYKIRIAYTGRFNSHIKLVAGEDHLIHDHMETGKQPIYEFSIPAEAYSEGVLELTWSCLPGERGTQVAEVWLVRE